MMAPPTLVSRKQKAKALLEKKKALKLSAAARGEKAAGEGAGGLLPSRAAAVTSGPTGVGASGAPTPTAVAAAKGTAGTTGTTTAGPAAAATTSDASDGTDDNTTSPDASPVAGDAAVAAPPVVDVPGLEVFTPQVVTADAASPVAAGARAPE